ncbi:uncharacterized protein LOC128996681 [Macrosteles quadrilineatus]|uniref:uncharacterized protein LOC128996681 n=1 Tax=Macrosteles quadrilineatus TaxID=74068 RepID=UPI0023E2EA9A|nr:uncharacterized protein LOC128996681 [Macrosteles quadrilineatus]
MMLKLLETLCKTTNKNSKPIFLAETQKQSKPHDIPIFNICDASFKMNDDQLKGLKTSIKDSRIDLLNERHDQEKDCAKLKNTEVDNLSSTVTVKENRWSQKLSSRNSLSSLADQSPECVKNKRTLGNYENPLTNVSNEVEKFIKHSLDKENYIASPQKKFELPTSDETKIQLNSKAGNIVKTNLSNQDKIPLQSMLEKSFENNLLKFHHEPSKSKILNNFVKANKNDLNLQCTEYKNVKEVKLRISDDKTKKNFITLPVEGNSSDICSISIEQSEHFNSTTKKGEELRESEVSMDLKREPKLSITILLTNNLNGGGQIQYNETESENVIETRNKASCHNKNSNSVMIEKNISNPNESSIEHRRLEKNISLKANVSFENIISPSVFEAVNKPDKCYARFSGDTNDTHILKAKLLSRPLLKPIHQQQFGIEGAAYLNQEQRKMLETKIAKNFANM